MKRFRARITLTAALTAALAGVAGCGGTGTGQASNPQDPMATNAAEANPNLDLGTPLGGEPAPDFQLVNQFGNPMSLNQFRGKVVMLGFEDSKCTTVCPLTTQAMVEARQLLGPAGDQVKLLGVDANPDATSVADVFSYSRTHGMVNQWDFLTGSLAQLKAVWRAYHIAVQIEQGQIDHTPALFVIDTKGRQQKLYLTQMAYSSVAQSAKVLAEEVSSLLPSHPRVASQQSLASVTVQGPKDHITLPSAQTANGTVTLGPGQPRLVMFFATWLSEIGNLKSELLGLNAYQAAARRDGLPQLVAVDETSVEPSTEAVRGYLRSLGAPLSYPVALDASGRVADGYAVQDQPWFALVSASGKIVWSHDGWLPLPALESAAKRAAAAA
jgi:cytochrome oxidase Cu insertion factor (SCO1/SenC/PrrC family)